MKKYLICLLSSLLAFTMCACSTGVHRNDTQMNSENASTVTESEENSAHSTEETSEEDTKKLSLKFSGLPYSSIVYTKDITTLNASNPWSEELRFTEMPVVEKRSLLTKQETLKLLRDLASGLGLTEVVEPVLDDNNEGDIFSYMAGYEGNVVISIYNYGHIQVYYSEGGLALPEGYSFDCASRDAATKRLGWFADTYAKHFGIDGAVQCVEPDYNEKGELSYSALSVTGSFPNTFLYPKGENVKEDMLNRFLYSVRFGESVTLDTEYNFSPNGTLGSVFAYVAIEGSLVNEYPIISVEEAKALLLDNKCYCPGTLDKDFLIKEDNVSKVELVYNRDDNGGACMPFYCFWLKAPDEEYAYYSCYVPAVEEKYLDTSDFSGWN